MRHQAENGGWLRAADLADFRARVEPPCRTRFGEFDVYGCGAWSQGPMVLQALNILEGLDLRGMGHNSPAYIHAVTEALKLAAADREAYFGDPDFVDVPLATLLAKDYAAQRRGLIDPARAWPELPPAGAVGGVTPPPWRPDPSAGSGAELVGAKPATSFLCVADRAGKCVRRHAERRDDRWAGRAGHRHPAVDVGLARLFRARPSGAGRSRPPAAHVGQSGDRDPAGTHGDAVRLARQRGAGAGDGAGVPQPGGVRHGPAIRLRGAALRQLFLAGIDPAAQLSARRTAGRTRCRRGDRPALAALGHRVEWWPERKYAAGSVTTIQSDLRSGMKWAGADPRRTAYAIGW